MGRPMQGKILWVNLSTKEIRYEEVPDEVYEKYLGGVGLAVHYLSSKIPHGADPLGPENVLAFLPGLLTGTGSLMTGRWVLAAKSPLTGTWGDANCGGDFAPAMKHCGADGIFFEGISETPVYLYADDNGVELRDASQMWGKDAKETDQWIKGKTYPNASVACIGQAGEKLSLIAGVVNDQGRLAARSGLGAVMGSKKLKAVALHGSQPIGADDPSEVRRLSREFQRWIDFQPPFLSGWGFTLLAKLFRILPLQMRQDGLLYKILLRKWGTLSMNVFSVETGDAPVRNWRGTSKDYARQAARQIDPDKFRKAEERKYYCYSCTVGCGGVSRVTGTEQTHKPEYETIIAWTSLLMNEDYESVYRINELLNRAGMDSISAGATVAFALECFEQGIITKEDTGGLELKWGDTASILKVLEWMISRQGIGDLLADGAQAAAKRLGGKANEYAMHAGGQELPMHDGRNDPGFALHSVVDPTPGRHTTGSYLFYEMYQLWKKVKSAPRIKPRFYPKSSKYTRNDEKAAWAAATSKFNMVMSASGLCMFGAFLGVQRMPIFEWLNAATGWSKSADDYMEIGAEIQRLRREFNRRQGMPGVAEINLRAIGLPAQVEGANKNCTVDLSSLVREYHREMGWPDSENKG